MKIEKLIIDIRGKKLELTLEQAKELKTVLSEILGADKVEHVHHYDHHVYPWRPWYGTYWCGTSLQTAQSGSLQGALQGAQCYQLSLNAESNKQPV